MISFTVLKGFSQHVYRERSVQRVASFYDQGMVEQVLQMVNDLWRQAGIVFHLGSYKEILPQVENPRPFHWVNDTRELTHTYFEPILIPQRTWDAAAHVNVFLVPYMHGTGVTFKRPDVNGRCNGARYIFLSENHPKAVVERDPSGLGMTLSHEIGHYFGLGHNELRGCLMYFAESGGGVILTPEEKDWSRLVASNLSPPNYII